MMISAIYVAKTKGAPQIQVDAVKLDVGKGIVGDRYYGKRHDDGLNITFVEQESIDFFNDRFSQQISASATRRNIVTQGVNLNDLVGKTFAVGKVLFYGVELCEPCVVLGRLLENESLSAPQIIRAWLHRGGLRANVLSSDVIRVGDVFKVE